MTEAKTPKQFFEEILPNRFKPEKAKDIDVTVQIMITGSKSGEWIVTIKNQKLEVKEGKHPSPTLTLEMAIDDYMDLINGRISGEKAFLLGKLKFRGNIGLALKLKEAFAYLISDFGNWRARDEKGGGALLFSKIAQECVHFGYTSAHSL